MVSAGTLCWCHWADSIKWTLVDRKLVIESHTKLKEQLEMSVNHLFYKIWILIKHLNFGIWMLWETGTDSERYPATADVIKAFRHFFVRIFFSLLLSVTGMQMITFSQKHCFEVKSDDGNIMRKWSKKSTPPLCVSTKTESVREGVDATLWPCVGSVLKWGRSPQ